MTGVIHQSVCFNCKGELGYGWRFCPSCGQAVYNDRPQISLSRSYDALFESIDSIKGGALNRSSQVMDHLFQKVRTSVSHHLDQAELVDNPDVLPLMFTIKRDGVTVQRIDQLHLPEGVGQIKSDSQGYYYQNDARAVFINGHVLPSAKGHYFVNGDCLRLGEDAYVFSLMAQEAVEWRYCWTGADISAVDDSLAELVTKDVDGFFYVYPDIGASVTINKETVTEKTRLIDGDLLAVDHRLLYLNGDMLAYQAPLKEQERGSIVDHLYTLSPESHLDVAIASRRAGDRLLLSDIQFSVSPGEMVLILGGSGAGKTTLINAIMGNEKADATILLGEYNVYKDFDQVRRKIANVPQFSLHREKDSVYMTLKNAAEMALVRDFVKDKQLLNEKIDQVLATVNLGHKKDSLVSALSGGEKKRLSIATEYISDPLVFILDEPDSGVDGSNARAIMSSLRQIADQGKMVLLISHNPDRTAQLFDKVLVLAKSQKESCGKLAFYGSVEETLDFFQEEELELVVSEIEERPDYYIEKYQEYLMKK